MTLTVWYLVSINIAPLKSALTIPGTIYNSDTKLVSILFPENSYYCVDKDDSRFQPMCCHSLVEQCNEESQLGALECQSLYGSYELSMPVDDTLDCSSTEVRQANCKDFDVSVVIVNSKDDEGHT